MKDTVTVYARESKSYEKMSEPLVSIYKNSRGSAVVTAAKSLLW